MNCDSTGEEKYPRARCRRKARVSIVYIRHGEKEAQLFITEKCWAHYLALEERARRPGATFRILKAVLLP